jgi:hypothetical protein
MKIEHALFQKWLSLPKPIKKSSLADFGPEKEEKMTESGRTGKSLLGGIKN